MNELVRHEAKESLSFARDYTDEDLDGMVDRTLELFDNGDLRQSNEAAVYNIHNLLEHMAEYAKRAGKKLSEREVRLMQESAGQMGKLISKAKAVEDPKEYLRSIADVIDESVAGTSHAKNSINLSEGKFGEYNFSAETTAKIEAMKKEQPLLEDGS